MTDQLTTARDQIAEMCGIVLIRKSHTESQPRHPRTWVIPDVRAWCEPDHPIPACLNFVSRVWPDGWKWSYGSTPEHGWRWTAQNKYSHVTIEMDMSDRELVDRLSLLVLVLEWLQAHDRPAFVAACEKVRKAMEEY